MRELTRIGEYNVRATSAGGGIDHYEGSHVVLPRRVTIELLEPAASRNAARALLRRACILEALHHPNAPRVLECGLFEGQLWVAFEHDEGVTLDAELRHRRLGVGEVLDMLEQLGDVLSHAHARGVLHRHIVSHAVIMGTTWVLTGWERACTRDAAAAENDTADADVYALAKLALDALAPDQTIPDELATLLARMLASDPTKRPTAAKVLACVDGIRDQRDAIKSAPTRLAVDAAIASVSYDDEEEVEIAELEEVEEEPVLLERPLRWTPPPPQWGVAAHVANTPGVVQIMPRRQR